MRMLGKVCLARVDAKDELRAWEGKRGCLFCDGGGFGEVLECGRGRR